MKFALYETHTVIRRLIIEADSEEEAKRNWRMDTNYEVDQDFYAECDDYECEEIEKIEEEKIK